MAFYDERSKGHSLRNMCRPVIPNGVREVRYGFASHVFCAMNPSFLGFPQTTDRITTR
jgi:hypothetical protein